MLNRTTNNTHFCFIDCIHDSCFIYFTDSKVLDKEKKNLGINLTLERKYHNTLVCYKLRKHHLLQDPRLSGFYADEHKYIDISAQTNEILTAFALRSHN